MNALYPLRGIIATCDGYFLEYFDIMMKADDLMTFIDVIETEWRTAKRNITIFIIIFSIFPIIFIQGNIKSLTSEQV